MAVRSEPGLTVAIPGEITPGTEMQRGFINDNVLHTPEYGDIHYSSYIPESYDGSNPYALCIMLPGWEGLYFQGVGANMVEDFGDGETDSYYGSKPLKDAYEKLHDLYLAEGLTESEIAELVILDIKEQKYFTDRGYKDQHMGGQAFAKDESIMGWLFGEH